MGDVPFSKGHGLGNDYIVIERAHLGGGDLTAAQARFLCDRHRGVGSDGVLLADLRADPVRLRIINPDGTRAEKSGNGLRIFGAYLYRRTLVQRGDWFEVALVNDTVAMRVEEELEHGAVLIRVRMGRADFRGAAVGFTGDTGNTGNTGDTGGTGDVDVDLGGAGTARVNTVSIGNPHCVVFVDELIRDDFLARAPRLCTHAAFEHGTNVQFARATGPHELEAWVWERGAGETTASGSSACAVAAAAVRRGLVAPGPVSVRMPGGSLNVTVSADYDIEMAGPAEIVYEGVVNVKREA